MTTCVFIHNPASRSTLGPEHLRPVLELLRAGGWDVEHRPTERAGHATELAREAAARGVDVVLVNGGDGTINEAVNGLAGGETALAVLPGGTANVWAKETHIDRDPMKAARTALSGERRRVDLGRAGDRYFLLMAGVGLDAAIIPKIGPTLKRRLGALAYIVAGAGTALRTRGWPVRITVDGEAKETSLTWMVAGNTRSYGGVVHIANRAVATDGKLDVVLMRRGGLWRLLVDGVRLAFRRHAGSPNIAYVRVTSVDIETAGIPVQVDGETFGVTPMRLEAVPGGLWVVVPRGVRTAVLDSGGPESGE
jgi:YegS/Rv2252/BmrU family lipid kinase